MGRLFVLLKIQSS